jgi:hypothetical protein
LRVTPADGYCTCYPAHAAGPGTGAVMEPARDGMTARFRNLNKSYESVQKV